MNVLSLSKKILCASVVIMISMRAEAQKNINGKIAAITEITPKTGFEKDILDAAKYIQKEASKESGCLLFSLSQEKSRPTVVVLYEVFQDQTALDKHKKQAHTKHFSTLLNGKYTENKVTFLNTINTYYN